VVTRKTIVELVLLTALPLTAADRVRTDKGVVEGTAGADSKTRIFKGIPFAAPPVGPLRWKAPTGGELDWRP
jgi:para-nitrobenzyl esterase